MTDLRHRPEPTDADVTWTEDRAIELMHDGIPFTDAVLQAARECSERVIHRQVRARRTFETEVRLLSERRREEKMRVEAAQRAEANERSKRLAEMSAQGKGPTLRATLGDLLARKGHR